MRMDRAAGSATAADLLRDLSREQLERLLRDGDEPFARRIAEAIVRRRREEPVTTTRDLAAIVADCKPRERRPGLHPATLAFQALRVAVNHEIEGLREVVADAASVLAPGGRLAIISFHGGEDREIKHALRELSGGGALRILTKKPVRPSAHEVSANPRSRSARLRAAERAGLGEATA
jgi:16S rRNA (cytosine1402-N4)-methyltransferase